ncbi:hypothetical protein OOK36_21210 [Streptomyces sp. NBC_00365]|uniref:hypothetical protein n=1 Tax=Streptomyces sp. NBC_00365 TaxID=2975726 RepID=UPI00224D1A1C|nr:hypothetical protein [Streptomyces sp. NBC_00365]MCX5091360.1 hypothetical protein [Streptomyces sp. NBC_00365]
MTRRSHLQRITLLAASTTMAVGGAVLPSSAFAATSAPHTAATTITAGHDAHRQHAGAASAKQWVETTDAASGIKFRLPGKPEVEKLTKAKDGVNGRLYMVETDDGIVGLAVLDLPGAQAYLDDGLRGFVDGYNENCASSREKLASTDVHKTTVDGRPALDTHLSAPDGTVGSARLIASDTHYVELLSLGPKENGKPMSETYQQLLTSLHMPDTSPTRAG